MTAKEFFYHMMDCVWPMLEPTDLIESKPVTTETGADDESRELSRLIDREHDRMRNIETKLQSFIPFASVSATLTVAIVTFATHQATIALRVTTASIVVLVFIGSYTIAQFIRIVWAAVEGLSRRPYRQVSAGDVVHHQNESDQDYRARILNEQYQSLDQNIETTNERVSQFAIACRATKNALVGLLALLVTFGVVLIYNNTR